MKYFLALSTMLLGLAIVTRSADAADVRVFVRHEVNDYGAWRKEYDAFQPEGKTMGAISGAVYQSVDNPNDVTVTQDFKTAQEAKAFASSPKLKAAMEKAGVKGPPQIWFTTEAAK